MRGNRKPAIGINGVRQGVDHGSHYRGGVRDPFFAIIRALVLNHADEPHADETAHFPSDAHPSRMTGWDDSKSSATDQPPTDSSSSAAPSPTFVDSELEHLRQQLALVWAMPSDSTHHNEYDINAALWARSAARNPQDLESLRRLVNRRLLIRRNWCAILAALNIPVEEQRSETLGYSDMNLYRETFGRYFQEDPIGHQLYFDGPGTIYAYFARAYGEEILKRSLFDDFKRHAARIVSGANPIDDLVAALPSPLDPPSSTRALESLSTRQELLSRIRRQLASSNVSDSVSTPLDSRVRNVLQDVVQVLEMEQPTIVVVRAVEEKQ